MSFFKVILSTVIVGIVYNEIQKSRKNPPVFLKKQLANNYNARTIPPFGIFIKESEKDNKLLLEHELIHWKQYQKMGLINFYSEYAKQMKQFGYDKMPMEIEARINQTEFIKYNYTEAVRNGNAKTIYNPAFRT